MQEVCKLPNGHTLLREENGVGGYRYWSDEVGGGVIVWDTALVSFSTLLVAIAEEARAFKSGQRQTTETKTPGLVKDDWWALWRYHHEAELEAANKSEYADAQYHKDRARSIHDFLQPDKT